MAETAGWNAEILKRISAAAMSDAYTLSTFCYELDKQLNLKPARMAEEAMTLNFVRRLVTASRIERGFTAGAILHSRQLESAHSKADLELVVKFSRNSWLNLVLQAKSLQLQGKQWWYVYWNTSQNKDLIDWCDSQSKVRGYKLTPGMLLYNEDVAPFNATQHKDPFGACDLTKNYEPPTSYWPWWRGFWHPFFPADTTPAGISMCLDVESMRQLARPTPSQLVSSHFPLEHLAHFGTGGSMRGPLGDSVESFLSEGAPDWARGLLERGEPGVREIEQASAQGRMSLGYVAIDLSERETGLPPRG